MKNFNKIFISVFAFVALLSCEQQTTTTTPGGDDTEVDVEVPKYGYIFFNIEQDTRATLEKGQLKKPFRVLGYRYPNDWNTVKIQAKQSKEITYANNNGEVVTSKMGVFVDDNNPNSELIEWNGSNHHYKNLREWVGALKYSFFAWYPDTLLYNTGAKKADNTTILQANYEGNPFVTYSYNGAQTKMIDVMTACEIDWTKAKGVSVPLKMKHRLAAFDVVAVSTVNADALNEVWDDNETPLPLPDDAEVSVTITNLTLTFNGLKSKVTIPLNTEDNAEKIVSEGSLPIQTYAFTGLTSDVPYYSEAEVLGQDDKLIFIPQTNTLTGTLDLVYSITCNGHTETYGDSDDDIKPIEFTINEGLAEGTYHYLRVTITKNGIFVSAATEQKWPEYTVEHEFN